jgi:hypothetical protein
MDYQVRVYINKGKTIVVAVKDKADFYSLAPEYFNAFSSMVNDQLDEFQSESYTATKLIDGFNKTYREVKDELK